MKAGWKYVNRAGKWLLLLAGLFLLLLFLEKSIFTPDGFFHYDAHKHSDDASPWRLSFTEGEIHVSMEIGNEDKIRYGRYAQLKADIDNWGDAFSGILQISLSVGGEEKIYRRKLHIAEEGQGEAVIYFPARMDDNQVTVVLVNDKGILYSKEVLLNVDYGIDAAYIGICSDEEYLFGYLEGNRQKTMGLSVGDLPEDFRGLDILDVLVISDVNMEKAGGEQLRAVTDWVKRGGTLVLADSGREEELAPFAGSLFEYIRGEDTVIRTSMGLSKNDTGLVRQRILEDLKEQKLQQVKYFLKNQLPKDLYKKWQDEIEHLETDSFCIENGSEIYTYLNRSYSSTALYDFLMLTPTEEEQRAATRNIAVPQVKKKLSCLYTKDFQVLLQTEAKQPILQKKEAGAGTVLLSGISLSLKWKYWDVLGTEVRECICSNISNQGKRQCSAEVNHDFDKAASVYQQGLRVTERNRLPNLRFYAAVLILYLLIIGPAAYFILRKRKRWYLLWGVLPAAAVVFSLVIYLTGTSTRMAEPYMNYLSQVRVDAAGAGNMQTWFRLVRGRTDASDIVFPGVKALGFLDSGVKYEMRDSLAADRAYEINRTLICQEDEGNRLQLQKQPPFRGVDLKMEKAIKLNGDITVDVAVNERMLSGSVTNRLGVSLGDCILYHNGTVYYLGTLASGRTAMLYLLRATEVYTQQEYSYDYNELARLLYGTDAWGTEGDADCEAMRKAALLTAYLREAEESQAPQTFFYGFADREQLRGKYSASASETVKLQGGLEQLDYDKYGVTGVVMEIKAVGGN